MPLIPVYILRLGLQRYSAAFKVQKYIEARLLQDSSSDNTIILVEHEPVYTMGLREKEDGVEIKRLEDTGAEVVHSDRGGLTTFHGPGQLVAYPILHLERFNNMQLRNYVSNLEHVAVNAARLLGVPAQLSAQDVSHTGAWANGNKLCAIGVHCKRYVTTHGLAMNCNVDLNWFDNFVPCGIKDKGVTSLSKELGEDVSIGEAELQLLTAFQNVFGCKLIELSKEESNQILNKALELL